MIRILALAVGLSLSAQDAKIEHPDTPEGLQKLNEDLLAAVQADDPAKATPLLRSLLLPDSAAWFKKVFGDETGARLQEEYAKMSEDFEKQARDLYAGCAKQGRTKVRALRIEKAGPEATGLQRSAFEAMKNPVALYTVKLTEPDQALGMSLWSFVHVDGTFRLAGKMRAARPPRK